MHMSHIENPIHLQSICVINSPTQTQTRHPLQSPLWLIPVNRNPKTRIMSFSSSLFSHNVCFTNQNTNLKLNKLTTKRPTLTPVSAFSTDTLDPQTLAVIGTTTAAAVAAAIYSTDPEKRRQLQASEVGGGDKEVVKEYFTNDGFQRWKKIYGDGDDVNKVQLDIRIGHAKTVESVMKMLLDEGGLKGVTVCDAGCGTGLLAVPLAKEGAVVYASDISSSMVAEATNKAKEELQGKEGLQMPKFEVSDLESLTGKYDTVVCLDVLIHYPQNKADGMIAHLASLAENRVILSFAPKTFYYDLLKRIGELFPGPSKATRAYLHSEADIEQALQKVGWKIRKRGLTTTQFYFSRIVEAVRA